MGCHCIVCSTFVIRCIYIYDGTVCVCVCVCERERERNYMILVNKTYFRVMLFINYFVL